MLRRLVHSALLVGAFQLGVFGCAKELDITEPLDPSTVVVAQFDPTNAIPILRLVPTPTGIVQENGVGDLDLTRVSPYPCEGPSTKQCLAFVSGGWPTTTPITLFFSGAVNEATIANGGIVLLENGRTPVGFTSAQIDRPPPPAACFQGGNGSVPDTGFTQDQVPPGKALILEPNEPLKPDTQYVLLVTNKLQDMSGKPVEPSALFHLITSEDAPVAPDGTIRNGLLRSNVEALVISRLFPGKTADQLTKEEHEAVEAAAQNSGKDLFRLYFFFSSIIEPLIGAGAAMREEIVFANAWTTASDPPTPVFDTATRTFPFPNGPLLTRADMTKPGGYAVSFPPDAPLDPAIRGGLNTLNGFSTTAPIFIPVTDPVDPMSVDPSAMTPCTADDCRVVFFPVGMDGNIDGEPVPLVVVTSSTTLAVVPVFPLLQNKTYVLGVRSGLTTLDGDEFKANTTFNLLKVPVPFIDGSGNIPPVPLNATGSTLQQALECSFVEATGMLGTETQIKGAATQLENDLAHQRWLEGFKALESAPAQIARTEIIMAFTYHTESIVDAVDLGKANIYREDNCGQAPCWERLTSEPPFNLPAGVRVAGPLVDIQGSARIAQTIGVVATLCVPICESGAMAPAIPAAMCATRDASGRITDVNAALPGHPLCQTAVQLVTSRIDRIRLYMMKGYTGTIGGPYQTTPGRSGTFLPTTFTSTGTPLRAVNIPMWVATGTTSGDPNAKFPVVIFQHGLGSQKEAGFYMANTLAATVTPLAPHGYATVMIDLPFHGSRASDLINNATQLPCDTDPAAVQCADPDGPGPQPTACTGGCDGQQDPSGTGFLGINLFATRDNFRQGTLDQLTLLRAIQEESAAGHPLSYLDGANVGYIGQSLGGITGGNFAAYVTDEEIAAVVLNVPGGGLIYNILLYTIPQISAPIFAALAARGICELVVPGNPASGCKPTPAYEQFKVVGQWILDPGDPYAVSIGVTRQLRPNRTPLGSEDVLIQMSLPDPVVPNPAAVALGRAYGFATDGSNDHFQIFDFSMIPRPQGTGCHPFLLAPVCGACLIDTVCNTLGAQIQAAKFVASSGALIDVQKQDVAGLDCDMPCVAP